MAKRVTNQDLADAIGSLSKRLDVIETEARIAKWVLRVIGAFFATLAAAFVRTFTKHQGG